MDIQKINDLYQFIPLSIVMFFFKRPETEHGHQQGHTGGPHRFEHTDIGRERSGQGCVFAHHTREQPPQTRKAGQRPDIGELRSHTGGHNRE